PAWVDSPDSTWLPNSASLDSEWITPFNGESGEPTGLYIYRTTFRVPATLPGGGLPSGVQIRGQLASDDPTVAIFLESPAGSNNCSLVMGQSFPVNPTGPSGTDSAQWWPFVFTNRLPITPGTAATLYFVVANRLDAGTSLPGPTGFRIEFSSSSI